MKLIRWTAAALVLSALTGPSFAADNALVVTAGSGVTTRSKDIGAGLQLPYVGLSDGSGNGIATEASGADTVSNTTLGVVTYNFPLVYNGSTWDRWYGDKTNGAWVNIKAGTVATTAADGSNVTLGAKADTACASPPCSTNGWLAQMHADVTSPIAAGTNIIGKVGIDQTTPGTTNGVQINAALPAGANIMGKVDIDQTTPGTTNGVSQQAFAAGGWSSKWFVAANSDNATNLKNAAGVVHSIHIYGIGSTPAWLKFYDKASSPTCNSDTIVAQYLIPANSVAANGAGNNATIIDKQFSTGISYCVVTGIAASDDTSVAAATFVVNIGYK